MALANPQNIAYRMLYPDLALEILSNRTDMYNQLIQPTGLCSGVLLPHIEYEILKTMRPEKDRDTGTPHTQGATTFKGGPNDDQSVIETAEFPLYPHHRPAHWAYLPLNAIQRMPTSSYPFLAHNDDKRIIQLECDHRSPTYRGRADDQRAAGIPLEMIVPILCARIKEQYHFTITGVYGRGLFALEAIAQTTG